MTAMYLRDAQIKAWDFLMAEVQKGGTFKFEVPAGFGKSLVLAESLRDKNVLFVSQMLEMRQQFLRFGQEVRNQGTWVCGELSRARRMVLAISFDVVVISDRLVDIPEASRGWGSATVIQLP